MAVINCEAVDAESLEELFEPTVEVPAALLLTCGCCSCCRTGPATTAEQTPC